MRSCACLPSLLNLFRSPLYLSQEITEKLGIDRTELPQQLLGSTADELRNMYLSVIGSKLQAWCRSLVDTECAVSDGAVLALCVSVCV
jgi:hypothetical protein